VDENPKHGSEKPTRNTEVKRQTSNLRLRWSGVELEIWTDKMLTALENGVKGHNKQSRGIGRCLHDHVRWPNYYFAKLGLFSMENARRLEIACRPR